MLKLDHNNPKLIEFFKRTVLVPFTKVLKFQFNNRLQFYFEIINILFKKNLDEFKVLSYMLNPLNN